MDELAKQAFVKEFEKEFDKLAEHEKEALFGVKTLLMGAKRLGTGIAGKAKAGLIKARVGAQKAQLGAAKAVQNIAAKPSRGTGGQFAAPGRVKKYFRAKTKNMDTSKLEASIAAGSAKAKQTSQIAGAKLKGTGTAVKRNWNVEKQDTSAFINKAKANRRIRRKARIKGDERILTSANTNAPKPINTKPKIDTTAPKVDKPKVKKVKKKKQQPILDVVGAGLVGEKSKYKTVAGGTALLGGGMMASNMIGGSKKKPAEQGIFFKSSSLNKTASLGGVTLGSISKEANKLKAVKMIGGGVAAGAAGMAAADTLTEPNPEQKMYDQGLQSFKSTFPELEVPQAEQMFKQVYQQYKKNQDIQLSKSIIQGASEAQKFGSFVHGFSEELSKEANIAAVGKLVSNLGYQAGRVMAGGKHLGNLSKTKKLTKMQEIGMKMMKKRKTVGTGIVAGGAGYMLGGRKND